MNNKTKTPPNPWPIAIISFFVFFITLTVAGVAYLSRQRMDLVRTDYYDDELRYQQQLDRLKRTQPFNGEVSVRYEASAGTINIILPSQHGQTPGAGRIHLYRPADKLLDKDFELSLGRDGVQRLDAKVLQKGLWKVRVYWIADGGEFFADRTVVVNPVGA